MGVSNRREREKLQRRTDIINAARTLFFTKGFRDTTIDDIAHSTELARGTIYLYFENKEEIYALILEEGLDILQQMVRKKISPDVDAMTNIINGHDGFMQFHDQYPQYYAVLILDKLNLGQILPAELKTRIKNKMKEIVHNIAIILQQGIDTKIFRPMDVEQTALMQMGIAMGFAQIIDTCDPDEKNADHIAHAREALREFIAHGLLSQEAR
jgi:AcrR family transcriptional regulator